MASLSLSSAFISADNPKRVNPSLLSNPSKLYVLRKPQCKKLSCKASKDVDAEHDSTQTDPETNSSKFDRRSLLLGGLGSGLYGAAATLGAAPNALAFPPNSNTAVLEFGPDISTCFLKDYKGRGPSGVPCCPTQLLTNPNALKTFVPGSFNSVRVRSAAHSISPENLAKFREAIYRMRNLPDTDPRSFTQQANVHCAYCDGAYRQVGDPDLDFKVHFSWIFFPFHRAYLYFFERILGKLIGDDTLAIPFWNWDHPDGMEMPKAYADNILGTDPDYNFDVVNSLYDPLRDQTHLPPVLVDFKFPADPPQAGRTRDQIIQYNLSLMKQTMVDTTSSESFMGGKYVKGEGVPSSDGKLERESHTHVHVWTGDKRQGAAENMGAFYSAGRDPIFYAHHANVDRLWSVWKSLGGPRKDFTDPQWLNTYFVFYDENAEPVKIYVRDCLDSESQLGYKYEEVESPWLPSDFKVSNATPSPATPPPPRPRPGPPRRPGPRPGPPPPGFRPGPPPPGPRPGPPPPGFRPGPRPGPGGPGRFRPMSMELDPNAAGAMLAVTAVGNMSLPNIAAAATATLESVTVDQLPETLGEEGFCLTGLQRTPGQTGVTEEVLLIDLDLLRDDVYVRFDVFINDATDDDNLTSYAGCFSSLAQGPHQESGGISEPRRLRLPIDAVLKSIGAENDEYVDVFFVPKAASDAVVINAATIEAVV